MQDKIFKLIPYKYEKFIYSLPDNASPLLKRHIVAALIAYLEENYIFSDMTEILEFLDIDNFSDNETDESERLIDVSVDLLEKINKIVITLDNHKKLEFDEITYLVVMSRLIATYEATLVILRNAYYSESGPLLRLIFEQIGWATSIIGKSEEEISKSQTTKNIKVLNELHPGISKLYGAYTSEAHLDISRMSDYLAISEDNSKIGYLHRSGKKSKERYKDIILLVSLYYKSLNKFVKEKQLGSIITSTIQDKSGNNIEISIQDEINTSLQINAIVEHKLYKKDNNNGVKIELEPLEDSYI